MMPRYRRRLLQSAQRIIYKSGLSALYSKFADTNGAVILMYHSVSSMKEREWIYHKNDMPASLFEDQIKYLANKRHVVDMDTLVQAVKSGESIRPGTVAITFDDGYQNNLSIAAPILAHYDLPATIYLATGYIERQEPQWVDELYSILSHRTLDTLEIDVLNFEKFNLFDTHTYMCVFVRLCEWLKRSNIIQRRDLLDRLRRQLAPHVVIPKLTMSWSDVRTITQQYPNITIGVHTRDHIDMNHCEREIALREIRTCVTDLQNELNRDALHYSYPYGSWNEELRNVISDSGFDSAVATDPVSLITAKTNTFSLPRIDSPKDKVLFKLKTSGAYPGVSLSLTRRL